MRQTIRRGGNTKPLAYSISRTRAWSAEVCFLHPSLDRAAGRLGTRHGSATRGGFSLFYRRRRRHRRRVQEIESGKENERPQIAAALAACRLRRACLVIAKLDRLTRNLHFVTSLMESGVDFVACDNPHATPLIIHILVAVAQHEREMISAAGRNVCARN